MTVRQAFYISIAAHIMFFGSAFAVAQYGRGQFLSYGDTMMVALVSPGQTSGKDKGEGSLQSRRLTATPPSNQADAVDREVAPDVHADPETASMRPSGQTYKSVDTGRDDPGLTPSASADAGQGTSPQFGVVAPPEWALIAAAIERTKNYPRLARERSIEGVVRLRFRLTSSGSVEKLEILQSSGSEILDSASISAVYRAVPMPYVSGWVEMPMKYVLK